MTTPHQTTIDCCILTCNNYSQAVSFFESLYHYYPQGNFDLRIKVLDNGSKDHRIKEYLDTLDGVQVTYSPTNLGCASGRRRQWLESDADILVYLDSDVVFLDNKWLGKILQTFDLNPDIGVIGAAGGWVNADWSWFSNTAPRYRGYVDVACGYCQAIRKSIPNVIRDSRFDPYWHEDSDFSLQVIAQGYKVYVMPLGLKHCWSKTGATTEDGYKNMRILESKWRGKGLTRAENTLIPNQFHFIFGMGEDTFNYPFYLAIKSAFIVNRPSKITLHYQNPGTTKWWEKVQQYCTLEKLEAPTHIFGRRLNHYAHQADVLRLEYLIEHGGIYLDIDTICLRPFTPLLGHSCVLGHQNGNYGLCNAVMLAEKQSSFLKRWYAQYSWFRSNGRDQYWDEHSVCLPIRLAEGADDVSIVNEKAFFPTRWNDPKALFQPGRHNLLLPFADSYCVHLWSTSAHSILEGLTPEKLMSQQTAYALMARPFIKDDL